jgi:hypothetical protein
VSRHPGRLVSVICSNCLVDGGHHPCRGGLVDHVAGAGHAMQAAMRDVAVEPSRLLVDVDQPVSFTRDDDNGHLKMSVVAANRTGVGNHKSRLSRGGTNLPGAKSHWLRKAAELLILGTRDGANIFLMAKGHISLPRIGERAGPDNATTSVRTAGYNFPRG